jgi:transposase
MFMKVLKQVLGIDVAQKELVVTLGRNYEDSRVELFAHKVFKNKESVFDSIIEWVEKIASKDIKVQFVMEATGVYHQKFAYYLNEKKYPVIIVLPNKISNYARTVETKTVTDKTASEVIARFGLERKLDLWHAPKVIYKNLQQLTRERAQLVEERVVVKNQLHAEQSEAFPNERSLKRIQARIKFLTKQEAEIKADIEKFIEKDQTINEELKNICTIPGVGKLTATIILAETNNFELIRNKKQLVSYAGLDIVEKQSGTSVKGKAKISKRGNKHIRRAMHLPAIAAIKHNEHYKNIYARLVAKNGIKMKGVVAVQRKLLELIYVVNKNKMGYQKDYEIRKREQLKGVATL